MEENDETSKLKFDTIAVHAGSVLDEAQGALSQPVYLTSSTSVCSSRSDQDHIESEN